MPSDSPNYRLAAYVAGSDEPVDTAEVRRFCDKESVWWEMRQRHPGAQLILEPTRTGKRARWIKDQQEGWNKAGDREAGSGLWTPENN